MRLTFLGTGTSHGVPMIGCHCSTCRSDDARDRRWRPSALLRCGDGTAVLIDTSPDLRAQALAFEVGRVDAILFTHGHADHILGLDEVRRYNVLQGGPIPCYGDAATIASVRQTFRYVFDPAKPGGGGVPEIEAFVIVGPFCLGRELFVPVPIQHGRQLILGYRVGGLAYLTDCSGIPDQSWPLLEGVEVLVLGALRERPHPTHFSIGEAVATAQRIGARSTWFTHMCHDLPHAATCARLPPGIALAHDGLTVEMG